MPPRLDLNNFDACPQYNDWIDEQYIQLSGTLDIFSFKPRPSFVLFTLSQDTYQAAFDDFSAQWQEQLKQTVFESFPSPIAHYFYRFENGYENELQRLHFLKDTWEAVIDVLHAIAIAECSFRGFTLADPIEFKHILTDSVNQRLLNIERIIMRASATGATLTIGQIVSTVTLQKIRELNQQRNAFSHSAAQSELQARSWIGECYEDVLDILDSVRALSTVELARYVGHVDATSIRCELLQGHSFTRTFRNKRLPPGPLSTANFFFRANQVLAFCSGDIFRVRPLISCRDDASGHMTKVCVFRKTRGQVPNRSIEFAVVGDSASYQEDRRLSKPELDAIRGLFGLGPD
jgi:hypothetical protein